MTASQGERTTSGRKIDYRIAPQADLSASAFKLPDPTLHPRVIDFGEGARLPQPASGSLSQ